MWKFFIPLFLIGLFLYLSAQSYDVDPSASAIDFGYVIDSSGFSREAFEQGMFEAFDNSTYFGKGDILLSVGRVTKNKTMICSAINYYEQAIRASSKEEEAVIYETIAGLGCGRNKKEYLLMASGIWLELNNSFRADIDKAIALGNQLAIRTNFTAPEKKDLSFEKNASKLILGSSYIMLDNEDVIVSQADRVIRDWLSYQMKYSPYYNISREELLTVFSERLSYSAYELQEETGWHEGARIKELLSAGSKHIIATGIVVRKIGNGWYATDDENIFRFGILEDKIYYPTTRFLDKETAIILDTHGISNLVSAAVKNNASVVIGCCDHPEKIKALQYLDAKGIKTVCFTDRYLPMLINSGIEALGSPPIKHIENKIVIGNQSVVISIGEPVIVEAVDIEKFALGYYDTADRYFTLLKEAGLDLNLTRVYVDDLGQAYRLIAKARELNSSVIALRVFNSEDYIAVREWLEESRKNRAVLFHSAAYPFGYKLLEEFAEQTSFDDINPLLS